MAAKRTDEQKAQVAAFVQQLFRLSGAPSWQEFARRAGVWSPNLSEWQTGTAIPDGWNLYSLVHEVSRAMAGGRETTAAEQAATAVAAGFLEPEDRRDLLAKLTAAVAVSNETNAAILARLEDLERGRVSQAPAEGDPQSADGG